MLILNIHIKKRLFCLQKAVFFSNTVIFWVVRMAGCQGILALCQRTEDEPKLILSDMWEMQREPMMAGVSCKLQNHETQLLGKCHVLTAHSACCS